MQPTEISYKRLVSFRDEEGRPCNETLGVTVQVEPIIETLDECKEKAIRWVETELLERGTLRETTEALQRRKEVLEHRVSYMKDILKENEILKSLIHLQEIEKDFDIPF